MERGTYLLPPPASTLAPEIDSLFYFIYWVSAIFFILIIVVTIFFILRYRRKREDQDRLTPGMTHSTVLELIWSIIPTVIFFVIFFWGAKLFLKMNIIPADAMEIRVTGQQWSWLFTYPNGASSEKLVVPDGKPIKLVLSSRDVIHSFFVPDFRVKMDALPNRYTSLWFEAENTGEHDFFCAEYCGQQHSVMTGILSVTTETEYAKFIDSISVTPTGGVLYKRYGCFTCHSVDGSAGIGPTFKGLFGQKEMLDNGKQVLVDDNYIRESILEPQAKIVKGYPPTMPTFQGTIKKQEELDAIIDFIKSLSHD